MIWTWTKQHQTHLNNISFDPNKIILIIILNYNIINHIHIILKHEYIILRIWLSILLPLSITSFPYPTFKQHWLVILLCSHSKYQHWILKNSLPFFYVLISCMRIRILHVNLDIMKSPWLAILLLPITSIMVVHLAQNILRI